MQRETYIRGNKKKKKIRQPDFPAEAPESSSNKCETGNAEHPLHDFSSESQENAPSLKSVNPMNTPRMMGVPIKKKSIARPRAIPKKVINLSWFPKRQQALCPKREIFH